MSPADKLGSDLDKRSEIEPDECDLDNIRCVVSVRVSHKRVSTAPRSGRDAHMAG